MNLGDLTKILEDSPKLPSICWERNAKNDHFPIEFNGTPYIFLGTREYHCHQGSDKNLSVKQKYVNKKMNLARGDHVQHIKSRKLAQPSKKLDCPVYFTVKKLFCFPEFSIEKDTNWQRSSKSKEIKPMLLSMKN